MPVRTIHVVPKTEEARAERGVLTPLGDLDGFMMGEAEPDPRGWPVVLPDGRRVGKVDDLIVDTSDMTVHYLEVKLDDDVARREEDRWVLVPLQAARIDDRTDQVEIPRLPRLSSA